MLQFIKDHNQKGQQAEAMASNYLQAQGLKKIQSNFSCNCGEIDLIMRDNEFLVFIEVRYRKQTRFGHPLETINYAKQKKIIKTVQYFLMKNPAYNQLPCRIDAVALSSVKSSEKSAPTQVGRGTIAMVDKNTQIDWVKNAIQLM